MKLAALWQSAARWRRVTLAGLVCAGIAATPSPREPPSAAATTAPAPATPAGAMRAADAGDTPPISTGSRTTAQPTAPSAPHNAATSRRDPPGSYPAYALQPSRALRVDELPPERETKPEPIPSFRGKDPRLRPSGPAELLQPDETDTRQNR